MSLDLESDRFPGVAFSTRDDIVLHYSQPLLDLFTFGELVWRWRRHPISNPELFLKGSDAPLYSIRFEGLDMKPPITPHL